MERQTLETIALLREDHRRKAEFENFEMKVKTRDGYDVLICTQNGQTFDTMMIPLNVNWNIKEG